MSNSIESMLGLRTIGRAEKTLFAEIDREVTDADILATQSERATKAVPIKKLRARHHGLAKAIADGIRPGEAAILMGFSNSHVSILQADPSFKDLVAFYSEKKDERYLELHDKIAALGEDVIDELNDRLQEEPDNFSIGHLLEVSKMALDRSGHGPQSSTNVNVNVGLADKLASARDRMLKAKAKQLQSDRMIDVTPRED